MDWPAVPTVTQGPGRGRQRTFCANHERVRTEFRHASCCGCGWSGRGERCRSTDPVPGSAWAPGDRGNRPGELAWPRAWHARVALRLFWSSPDRSFDLDQPFMLRWFYQTVLREASRPEDLTDYLDRDTLIVLWPELHLPRGVRRAWEDHHPVLRATARIRVEL